MSEASCGSHAIRAPIFWRINKMAYKFQRGAAIISGSLQAEEGLQSIADSDVIASGSAANIKLNGDGGAGQSFFDVDVNSNQGRIRVNTNAGAEVFKVDSTGISGSGQLDILGASTFGANTTCVATVSGAVGTFGNITGTGLNLQVGGITNAGSIAGATTITGSGQLSVGGGVVNAGGINNQSSGITNAGAISGITTISGSGAATLDVVSASILASADLTAGRVPFVGANGVLRDSSKLAYNDTAGSGLAVDNAISGSGVLTVAGNISTDGDIIFAARNTAIGAALGANNLTLGQSTSTVVVAGNLTVQGTTTTIDTTNTLIKDKLITLNDGGASTSGTGVGFEIEEGGSATGFIKTDASDRTQWTLQAPGASILTIDMDAAGEIEFSAAKKLTVGGNFNIDDDITAIAHEINVVADGNTTVSASLSIADADGIILNDNGVMKQIRASNLKDYVAGSATAVSGTITLDGAEDVFSAASVLPTTSLILVDAGANAVTVTMPSASTNLGRIFIVKDSSASAASNNITITSSIEPNNGNGFDGDASIVLESNFAAVSLIAVSGGQGFGYAIF